MAIALDNAPDVGLPADEQLGDATESAAYSPYDLTPEALAFCVQALQLSDRDARQLTAEEFADLCDAYANLGDVERFAAGIELGRRGIHWTVTLDIDAAGGNAMNGFAAYNRLRNA